MPRCIFDDVSRIKGGWIFFSNHRDYVASHRDSHPEKSSLYSTFASVSLPPCSFSYSAASSLRN